MIFRCSLALVSVLVASPAFAAAEATLCKPFDRAPVCCPHPAPVCCPAPVRELIDDELVLSICGAATVKGQSAGVGSCKRYFAREALVSEVSISRQAGDSVTFDKLRRDLAGARNRIEILRIPGAISAFILRELDDQGAIERSSAWAFIAGEIISVEAERGICDDTQVQKLLAKVLERVAHKKP